MQKVVETREPAQQKTGSESEWISTEAIQTVHVSSEDPSAPIENVFNPETRVGWRAGNPGEQQIRLTFGRPIRLRRIQLEFAETQQERTQEFVLQWAESANGQRKEIVRQRWNFSPSGSAREFEDYKVNLDGVSVLELNLIPDISRPDAIASLAHLRIA